MTLMRGFSRVDKEGRIPIPGNIRREVGFDPGQLVEVKVSGPQLAQYVVIKRRKAAR
jgi:bifunctional DNA-binding transcriptional regulator/antitoxin component of YhaV-PrlF toxin-antitoxin module